MNIAAHAEQTSGCGKVNISDATHEPVKDKFRFTYGGEIDAKNKGKMYYAPPTPKWRWMEIQN